MENSKVFIGNLDFAVTDEEIRILFSDYGSVVNIKLHKKKGYAFVEMSNEGEAALAIEKLNNSSFKDREIRVSLELRTKKAKALSIKKYNERSESFSRQRKSRNPDHGKPEETGHYSMKDDHKKDSQNAPRHRTNRPAARRPDGSPHPHRKEWQHEKPERTDRPPRDGNKSGQGRTPKTEINYNSWDRFPGPVAIPAGEQKRGRSGSQSPQRKEWSHDKPSYSSRPPRDGKKPGRGSTPHSDANYNSRERYPRPEDRPARDFSRGKPGTPHPQRKEWSHDKPSYSSRPSGPSRQPGGRSRDDSRPRHEGGSPNRFSSSNGPKQGHGGKSSGPHSARPKARGGAGNRERNNRGKKD